MKLSTGNTPVVIIREEQAKDPTFVKILQSLPDEDAFHQVNEYGMNVAHLWSQRKRLMVGNETLHRKYELTEGLILHYQVLVPPPLRRKFLYWTHRDPISSYFGIAKSVAKLEICILFRVKT